MIIVGIENVDLKDGFRRQGGRTLSFNVWEDSDGIGLGLGIGWEWVR